MPVSQSSTLQVPKLSKYSTFTSETDLYDGKGKKGEYCNIKTTKIYEQASSHTFDCIFQLKISPFELPVCVKLSSVDCEIEINPFHSE